MVATTWFADGSVTGYDASTGALAHNLVLATGGNVDAGGITRAQYMPVSSGLTANIQAIAKIRLSYDDYFYATFPGVGGNPDNEIYGFMAVVPVVAGAPIPAAEDVWGAAASGAGFIFRSLLFAAAPAVGGYTDVTWPINGPLPTQLQPNTKYWITVIPMAWRPALPLSGASFLHSYTASQARGISIWTNRTPSAPVISSPSNNSVVPSSSSIALTITKNDADKITGGPSDLYTDIAGVQVQYAPRPTVDNPSPTWTDLPWADSGGTLRKGWWIKGASANVAGEGLAALVSGPTAQIRVGASTPTASQGFLPSGSWQIRVRTFDFGHSFPGSYPPLGTVGAGGAYTASTYPAVNTSPWSTPVIVTVSAQVPSPIPTSPIGNSAVVAEAATTLNWQYRNTAVPPYPQARRTVRIRKVGDATWTYLANDAVSASQSIAVSGFTLVSGNQYEWQVSVKDSTLVASTYSEIARFWAVPSPGSGGVRPLPTSTIEGATLGCGQYTVEVFRRGGENRTGEITGVTEIEWNRLRDDISDARVVVENWGIDCGNLLAMLEPWAYELRLTRDNGFSKDKVWEGPITLITYETDRVVINAKDMMAIAYRRIIKQKMSDTANGDTVTSRAARVLQNAFGPDDPNVLAYMIVVSSPDDAMQYRSTPAYSRTAFEEVDDMASNSGLDYTCVGRSIILWGTKNRIGTLPEFQDRDLGNTPVVSVYGMQMANRYAVSDGNGLWGEATRLDADGQDDTYGLIEMLSSSWASDSSPDEGTYTQEGVATIIASFEGFAERSIASRYPVPVVVRIPDNTTINPDTVISIQHLVPGVVIPLRSTGTLRTVVANQKLDSVKAIINSKGETISIWTSPFAREDSDTEGEVE